MARSTPTSLTILLLAGCAGSDRDPADFEADPPGAWYAGDVHVHATGASNDTGGDSLPEAIVEKARERGLDFVVLTDHSDATGSVFDPEQPDPLPLNQGPEFPYWDRARELSDDRFLLIDGNELSPIAAGDVPTMPAGHIGCLPADLDGFELDGAFVDRPRGSVTGGESLTQAIDRGCYTVLNHPYADFVWITYDWTNLSYDAIEIWNGGNGFDEQHRSYDAWRCDLLAGRNPTPIGASDNHRVNLEPPGDLLMPALGYPKTWVFAERLLWPAIIDGLRSGRVSIGEGASRLFLDAYDLEKNRTDSDIRILRLRGELDPQATVARLMLLRASSCSDPRPTLDAPTVEDEILFERAVRGGSSFDEAIEIDALPGVYSAMLIHEGSAHYHAFSRGVVLK